MKRNVITVEHFKEPQESDVFEPYSIVWSSECGWAYNYRLCESLE